MAKKEDFIHYLDYPDLLLRFFAERAYKDGDGNDIPTHYAKITALQQVIDNLQAEASKIETQKAVVEAQGNGIINATEIANKGVSKAQVASNKAEAVEGAQMQYDERLNAIRQTIALLEEAVKDLQAEASEITSIDKGVYLSEVLLNTKVANPEDGECASVVKPFYLQGETFSPSAFYGDKYIGIKSEHGEWANNTESVNHLYYTSYDVLYEIVKPTTLQYIADAEHNPDSELVEEGIVVAVTPIEVAPNSQVPFYLYVAEGGKWHNSHIVREFANNVVVQSYNVLDNGKNQQVINDVNMVNALLQNYNLTDIQNAINALISNFTALLEKVCVTGEVELQQMRKVVLSRLTADGDGSNTRLDVCALPITLS